MRTFSRSKMSTFLALLALVTLACGFAIYGVSSLHSGIAHAAGTNDTYTGTRGNATFVGTTRITPAPPAAKQQSSSKPVVGAEPLRLAPGMKAPTTRSGAPSASGLPLTKLSPLHNFDGLNSTQNLETSTVGLEPPDEGVAFGNGYVINIVNLVLAV